MCTAKHMACSSQRHSKHTLSSTPISDQVFIGYECEVTGVRSLVEHKHVLPTSYLYVPISSVYVKVALCDKAVYSYIKDRIKN